MSAILAATLTGSGPRGEGEILSGVTTAIAVNAVLCLVTAVLVAVFLRPARHPAG